MTGVKSQDSAVGALGRNNRATTCELMALKYTPAIFNGKFPFSS